MIVKKIDFTLEALKSAYGADVAGMDASALNLGAQIDCPVIGSDGLLCDGYHRIGGYLATYAANPDLADEIVEVVQVFNEDLAGLAGDKGGSGHKEALELIHALAGDR